jgi:catechol 2,3-dioxygenase
VNNHSSIQEERAAMEQKVVSSIHPATHIGQVTLRVAQLQRSRAFYEGVLGFQVQQEESDALLLGSEDGSVLLRLQEVPETPPQSRRSAGLYHVAILLPSRSDLGRFLLRIAEAGIPIGQGDHLVSEALYLSDPDENGLEIYRDRPRSEWEWKQSQVTMAVDPVDTGALLAEAHKSGRSWEVMPAGTSVGHIHLRVGNIAQAEDFYHAQLGFDITAKMPGALFVSAGGYHHHIGLNTWESRGAGQASHETAGLEEYQILVPDNSALEAIQQRLQARGTAYQLQDSTLLVSDPWGNQIRIRIA